MLRTKAAAIITCLALAFACRGALANTPSLEQARNVPVDINHGIRDGHGSDPVPVSQSLTAFNALAAPQDRLTDDEIAYFTNEAKVPPHLRGEGAGDSTGPVKVLSRRQSGNARITIFDGAHDKNTEAAFQWLNIQHK